MVRSRALGIGVVGCLIVSFVWVLSVIAETSPTVVTVPSETFLSLRAISYGSRAPLFTPLPREENLELITIEASEDVSLLRLRRELNRYMDQDLLGRFAEVATECPPLFGSES